MSKELMEHLQSDYEQGGKEYIVRKLNKAYEELSSEPEQVIMRMFMPNSTQIVSLSLVAFDHIIGKVNEVLKQNGNYEYIYIGELEALHEDISLVEKETGKTIDEIIEENRHHQERYEAEEENE